MGDAPGREIVVGGWAGIPPIEHKFRNITSREKQLSQSLNFTLARGVSDVIYLYNLYPQLYLYRGGGGQNTAALSAESDLSRCSIVIATVYIYQGSRILPQRRTNSGFMQYI